jgi:hypothetical protein
LPHEVFFGRVGFAAVFLSVCGSDCFTLLVSHVHRLRAAISRLSD